MFGWPIDPILWCLFSSFLVYRLWKVFVGMIETAVNWWLAPWLGWTIDVKAKYRDKWVVATGCTDGIGRAYVEELAKRGLNKFLLIGRNVQRLDDLTDLLKSKYKLKPDEVETHVFDFATDDFDKLPVQKLKTYEIGILFHCVGTFVDRFAKFHEHPAGLGSKILRVNAFSTCKMTELVLPGMVQRDDGIIVNVASLQAWRPMPMQSSYSASKALAMPIQVLSGLFDLTSTTADPLSETK